MFKDTSDFLDNVVTELAKQPDTPKRRKQLTVLHGKIKYEQRGLENLLKRVNVFNDE